MSIPSPRYDQVRLNRWTKGWTSPGAEGAPRYDNARAFSRSSGSSRSARERRRARGAERADLGAPGRERGHLGHWKESRRRATRRRRRAGSRRTRSWPRGQRRYSLPNGRTQKRARPECRRHAHRAERGDWQSGSLPDRRRACCKATSASAHRTSPSQVSRRLKRSRWPSRTMPLVASATASKRSLLSSK